MSTETADPVVAPAEDAPETVAAENVIEIRNLTKIYRDFWGRKKVRALNSLSLDVRKGEVFGLLGPNGSGKTTTLKLLLGLLFPTDGEIRIFGKTATDVSKNDRIGYLPEESYLYRFLNAEETLDFYGRLFNLPARQRRKRRDELIDLVKLSHARKRPLKEYSKGMTRRIGIAQALINDPEVVFLDEPTSGLDPNGRADMKAIITDLKERGKTVVVCSHLLAEIEDICDRVAILGNGELQLLGSVEDLLRSKNQTQITAETLPPEAISEIESVVARYSSNGVAVANPRRTLEEVFLATGRMSEARPGRRFVDGDNPLDVDAAAATEDGSADPAGH